MKQDQCEKCEREGRRVGMLSHHTMRAVILIRYTHSDVTISLLCEVIVATVKLLRCLTRLQWAGYYRQL